MSGDEDEFVLEEWFSKINLSVAAATKLRSNQIEDLHTLNLMREVDVDSLKL